MKPYIITHMMTTVDGRIDCPVVGQLSTDEYYIALERLGTCSKLSGRVTAELECPAVNAEDTSAYTGTSIGKESFHIAQKADEYAIVVDTHGKMHWKSNEAEGNPMLCIISEDATRQYVDTLDNMGISWIATGNTYIDMPRAMEILHDEFGVERLAIVGGGHICGGFLEAGLVDEASVMVAPGIDGRTGQTAMFDGITDRGSNPYKLKLESVEQWETDIVWLRYKLK